MQPKLSAYLDLEASLAKAVRKEFAKAVRPIVDEIELALRENRFDDARRLVNEVGFAEACKNVKNKIEVLGIEALLLGASRVVKPSKSFLQTDGIPPQLEQALAAFVATLTGNSTDYLRKQLLALVAKKEAAATPVVKDDVHSSAQVFQKAYESDDDFIKALNGIVDGNGKSLTDVSANLTTSRLVSYGMLVQSSIEGFTSYQFTAELDDRTCPVCSQLHGQTFDVSLGIVRLEKLFETEDPNSLKTIAPFPDQSAAGLEVFQSMAPKALENVGWSVPPLHPGCRCQVIPSGVITTSQVGQEISPTGSGLPSVAELNAVADKTKSLTGGKALGEVDPILAAGSKPLGELAAGIEPWTMPVSLTDDVTELLNKLPDELMSGTLAAPAMKVAASSQKTLDAVEEVLKIAKFDRSKVTIHDAEGPEFFVGKIKYRMAASARSKDGTIKVYLRKLNPSDAGGIVTHELQHVKFEAMVQEALSKKTHNAVTTILNDPAQLQVLRESDGVSEYSRAYWKAYEDKMGSQVITGYDKLEVWHGNSANWDLADLRKPIHETLAEISRDVYETGRLSPMMHPQWVKLWNETAVATVDEFKAMKVARDAKAAATAVKDFAPTKALLNLADEFGIPYDRLTFRSTPAPVTKIGEKSYTHFAKFYSADGKIDLFDGTVSEKLLKEAFVQQTQVSKFTQIVHDSTAQMDTPIAKLLSDPKFVQRLKAGGAPTDYSKALWKQLADDLEGADVPAFRGFEEPAIYRWNDWPPKVAVEETLGEIARLEFKNGKQSWLSKEWQELYDLVKLERKSVAVAEAVPVKVVPVVPVKPVPLQQPVIAPPTIIAQPDIGDLKYGIPVSDLQSVKNLKLSPLADVPEELIDSAGNAKVYKGVAADGTPFFVKDLVKADVGEGIVEILGGEIKKVLGADSMVGSRPLFEAEKMLVTEWAPGKMLAEVELGDLDWKDIVSVDSIDRTLLADFMVGDVDRHSGNFLVDVASGRLVSVDHMSSFGTLSSYGEGSSFSDPLYSHALFTSWRNREGTGSISRAVMESLVGKRDQVMAMIFDETKAAMNFEEVLLVEARFDLLDEALSSTSGDVPVDKWLKILDRHKFSEFGRL